jgi:putative ABC transport system permease protein
MDDVLALEETNTGVNYIVPQAPDWSLTVFGTHQIRPTVIAIWADFFSLYRRELLAGRFFTDTDAEDRRRVAVVGIGTAETLGLGEHLVGETIRISGVRFEVVGVAAAKGPNGNFGCVGSQIIIPLESAIGRTLRSPGLTSIYVQVSDPEAIIGVATQIERTMRQSRSIELGEKDDFRIQDSSQDLILKVAATTTFEQLLMVIGVVSLVVGGVVVMKYYAYQRNRADARDRA